MKAKVALHISGLSVLLACAFLTLFTFMRVATQGYFYASEPDAVILYFEVACGAFGFAYVVYLFKTLLGGGK